MNECSFKLNFALNNCVDRSFASWVTIVKASWPKMI